MKHLFLRLQPLLLVSLTSIAADLNELRNINHNDEPTILSPHRSLERNLVSLDLLTPQRKELQLQPWANKHWRLDSGLTAMRYNDWNFFFHYSFKGKRNYINRNSASRMLSEPNRDKRSNMIDSLSPAEKYDLLVGDSNYTLTQSQWREGDDQRRGSGLASWMGICDGTAAASIMYPEPKHSVTLLSPSGNNIEFHILDIKALAALLWSVYNIDTPVAGSRCLSRFPKKRNGVVVNENCFDNNPGAFHTILLNFVGLQNRSFVINRHTGLQVWNVPVVAYNLTYRNPRNGRAFQRLDQAKESISNLPKDRYTKHRSPEAQYLVSVDMTITVSKGMTDLRDDISTSKLADLDYSYDLELDRNNMIIGGEWHNGFHPDFMWAIEENLRPTTVGDSRIGEGIEWEDHVFPISWLESARLSSAKNQPLEKVVRKLVELAQ